MKLTVKLKIPLIKNSQRLDSENCEWNTHFPDLFTDSKYNFMSTDDSVSYKLGIQR